MKIFFKRLCALTGIVILFTALPLMCGSIAGTDRLSGMAAYAKDGGDGDGGGDSDGGDSDGGGNTGSGGGNSGSGGGKSGRGGDSGRGKSARDHSAGGARGTSRRDAAPDVIVEHLNGWVEGIVSGIYFIRDSKNRTVIRRSATPKDSDRMAPSRDR